MPAPSEVYLFPEVCIVPKTQQHLLLTVQKRPPFSHHAHLDSVAAEISLQLKAWWSTQGRGIPRGFSVLKELIGGKNKSQPESGAKVDCQS